MVQRWWKSSYIFIMRMVVVLAVASVVSNCAAPWRASVPEVISLPGRGENEKCGRGQSCEDFEHLLASIRTAKGAFLKSYARSADAAILFDAPLAATAVAAASAAMFGAHGDLLKGLGVGAGVLVLGRSYVSPKESARLYRLAARRLSCVEVRARPLRDVDGSSGWRNTANLKDRAKEIKVQTKNAETRIAQYEEWFKSVADIRNLDAERLKVATLRVAEIRGKLVEANTVTEKIEVDLVIFDERLSVVHETAEAIVDALASSLMDGRTASFDGALGVLQSAAVSSTGFSLSKGVQESASGVVQPTASGDLNTALAQHYAALTRALADLESEIERSKSAIQNYPALYDTVRACSKLQ